MKRIFFEPYDDLAYIEYICAMMRSHSIAQHLRPGAVAEAIRQCCMHLYGTYAQCKNNKQYVLQFPSEKSKQLQPDPSQTLYINHT
jgi:hypothetical protein